MDGIGDAIRRARKSRGWSQGRLAAELNTRAGTVDGGVTREYVSRWESGRVTPGSYWRGHLAAVLAVPEAVLLGLWMDPDLRQRLARTPVVTVEGLDSLDAALRQARAAEDRDGGGPLLAPARAQLALLDQSVMQARGRLRPRVLGVAAQWAQFAGWLHAAANIPVLARWYYDRATEWGQEIGDANMLCTIVNMRGTAAFYNGRHVPAMLGLSQAAQRFPATPGVLSLAAQQEARAHALLGDPYRCDQKLDEAVDLVERAGDDEPPWTYFFTPEFLLLQRGRAYRYLGRYDQAAELLTEGLAAVASDIAAAPWLNGYVSDLQAATRQL